MSVNAFTETRDRLHQELMHSMHYFEQFQILFNHSPERSALLFESCDEFFDDIFFLFLERIVLGICRATDPARQGRSENLTFAHVTELAKQVLPTSSVAALEAIQSELNSLADHVRPWRSKLIAHMDRGVALGKAEIHRSIPKSHLADFFDRAALYFKASGMPDSSLQSTTQGGDAHTLIECLKDAMAFGDLFDRDPLAGNALRSSNRFNAA